MTVLTKEELVAITGYKRPSKQKKFLQEKGIPIIWTDRAGYPVVHRSALEDFQKEQQLPSALPQM